MGTAVRPAKTAPGPWDAFVDVDVFVDEVLAELAAMAKDGARPMRSGPKPPLAGQQRCARPSWRSGVFVSVACSGGRRSDCCATFRAAHSLWAVRPSGLGSASWRRFTLNRLRRTWRLACSDTLELSAVVIDSRSCRSAPSCFDRGIDGGKKIRGVKIHVWPCAGGRRHKKRWRCGEILSAKRRQPASPQVLNLLRDIFPAARCVL